MDEKVVNSGFSKISHQYEALDSNSNLITWMRQRVYNSLIPKIKGKTVLELNCGTGIDAVYLAKKGFKVHATDISEGMLSYVKSKIISQKLTNHLSLEKLNFVDLNILQPKKFSHIFSNFGGLNCISLTELEGVVNILPNLLAKNGAITLVIMPKICVWELLKIFRFEKKAFRRLKINGVYANVEGEKVKTYYHSKKSLQKILKHEFTDISFENICTIGPTGNNSEFPKNFPFLFKIIIFIDRIANRFSVFTGIGDYYIVNARIK